ncbi:glycosyltransferase [Archaeoglobus profundus]|uniref:Glycosyl transferase group 1 n=1 Tax=Archaeoglobus profundus (strain DSM 5631 / JCM 9629 / NBRC 100127 / Av18) TaxID=572546 RepID=D2RDE8_ARCPA|nr:glycosyltransferase [Archaeoglobus profundus]ADB58142.1 glycosyl transferase group 1 [Archaeoglobus profundus DSM 5631]
MRVGFVSRYPPVHCGIAEYTKMLSSAMRSLNPRTDVVVLSTNEFKNEQYNDDVANVYPCYSRFERDYSKLLETLKDLGSVDVLHVQHEYGIYGSNRELIDALLQAKEEGLARAVGITMHTVDHPHSPRADVTLKFQSWLNELDFIIVHSPLQEFELHIQEVNPSKVYRIPHGTLINPYLCKTREELCRSLGIECDLEGVILTVPGFLRRDKGIDTLIESLRLLSDLKFTLLIAGEPKDEEIVNIIETSEFKTVLIERYLSSDEILRVVALADAIILPYKDRKAYSVSGILHLSMGSLKPIIGTRVPRLVEFYQHAPRLTVPPNDPIALANKIRWLVNNYDYALAYMTEVYSYAARTQWLRMASRHIDTYLNLLK